MSSHIWFDLACNYIVTLIDAIEGACERSRSQVAGISELEVLVLLVLLGYSSIPSICLPRKYGVASGITTLKSYHGDGCGASAVRIVAANASPGLPERVGHRGQRPVVRSPMIWRAMGMVDTMAAATVIVAVMDVTMEDTEFTVEDIVVMRVTGVMEVTGAMMATEGRECPFPRHNAQPSMSTSRGDGSPTRTSGNRRQTVEPLVSKVAEIGKSVAAVCQYVELEQRKRAAKERRKAERKEVEERAEAERAAATLSKKKKEEQARKDAEAKEELHKSLDGCAVGELREDVREDVPQEIRKAINELCMAVARGKQKWIPLSLRRGAAIVKRKRGAEVDIEGSPPMKLPPKRTPRRAARGIGGSGRLTRSRARTQKAATPKKTPPSIRKKTPATIGVVGRLRFEKRVLNDLKNLDALVLQNICKDNGIPYNGKIEAIFDIAAHRTHVAYETDNDEEVIAPPVVSADASADEDREEEEG
ncbi:hypothetical protein CBR_g50215 [Chara braunii]|uniref:Uncharacterized protein n=1 Tax=Chara braunii TaxID=69332 RepID=A0A388M6M4_CHABU|nr:hypothetical protein CBR_g50215 [Chara braunii]|eukprot:GBG90122.1 hypothetical protein CBR_g50215 [Chara braunii]